MSHDALNDFHREQGHPGEPAGCPDCAAQKKRQADDARALKRARAHAAARALDPKRPT